MTQENALVNDHKLLRHTINDTTHKTESDTMLAEAEKQSNDITGNQVIKELSLIENSLNYLSHIFIEHLSEIIDLNLCNSKLNDLPSCLSMLKILKYLNLDDNQFSSLPNVICELNNLEKLWACRNKIKQIPNNLGNLSNLKVLSLSTNCLTDLPSSCAKLNKLEACCLSNNRFKRIPDCVVNGMESLQILIFSQNCHLDMNVYPRSTNLNSFYAEENNCSPSFPNWILNSKYNKLETVALSGTRFQMFDFPKDISVSYVKRLWMKQCDLQNEYVERIIAGMINLEDLIVGNSKITFQNYFLSMPIRTGENLSSLKQIDMCRTGLIEVPKTINKFVDLMDINLSSNSIYTLPEEFCSLKNLKRLIIDNNRLTNFPENIGDLISLKELKARHNHLEKLPDSMKSLSNLEYMDLYNNEFETVPEVISSLPCLKGLDLEQNYFSTDCLGYTRVPCYKSMREAVRNYWLDRMFDYESICGPKANYSSSDNLNILSSSSSTSSENSTLDMQSALCSLPEVTYNELMKERWDSSEDSADEFDPYEYKEPRKRIYSPLLRYKYVYCPGYLHQSRVITRVSKMLQDGTLVWPSNYEEGQFEDP